MTTSKRRCVATVATTIGVAMTLGLGPAHAAVTPTTTGTTLVVTSDSAADSISIGCLSGNVAVNGITAAPALGCTGMTAISITAGDGGDTLSLGSVSNVVFPALELVQTQLGPDFAIDTYTGSAVRDEVFAGSGDIVSTGDGNDRIEDAATASGGDGDDALLEIQGSAQGGPGDDRIYNPGQGPMDGGSGHDVGELDFTSINFPEPITVEVADSSVTLSSPSLPPNALAADSMEEWHLTMPEMANGDTVDSRTYSGAVVFRGVAGADSFLGGRGADIADGGTGDDNLAPGKGSDTVRGGPGGDTISVRDGVADIVDCGPGGDVAIADRVDVLSGCETVSLPPPGTSKIAGPKKVTKGEKATFTFSSEVANAKFQCKVDKGAYKSCKSPLKVKTKNLSTGKHKLFVRAMQPTGNVDTTPSKVTFKVVALSP